MDLKAYKQRNRKEIELPSGLGVTIKKLSIGDVYEMGGTGFDESSQLKSSIDMVCKCVTGPFKVVDKPVNECGDDELSVSDLDNQDFEFVINAITEFSGLQAVEDNLKKSQPES